MLEQYAGTQFDAAIVPALARLRQFTPQRDQGESIHKLAEAINDSAPEPLKVKDT